MQEKLNQAEYTAYKVLLKTSKLKAVLNEIRDTTSAPMSVVGLIEDGLFEEEIQASAALLGEMLWNPRRDEKDVLNAALSAYYRIVQ